MAATSSDAPVRLFCGYHRKDTKFYQEFRCHLAPLVNSKKVDVQHSRGVPAGAKELAFLNESLLNTQILVLLVSSDLLADDLWSTFWTPIVEEIEPKRMRLVPVRVRGCDVSETSLDGRELLPRGGRSVRAWPDRDEAWSEITKEISEIANERLETIPSRPADGTGAAAGAKTALAGVQHRKDLAHDLKYRGRGKEALAELRLALKELDALTGKAPDDDASLRKERAHLHDRIAQCEYAQGRFHAARAAFDLAFEIRIGLCTSYPSDTEALFDLSTSRFWRGYMSYLQDDLSRARDEQREGVEVCKNLCARDAGDIKAARSLVVLETDLGTTLWEMGDEGGAEKHLRASLASARDLAKKSPDNRQIHRDVSVGLFRLADLLVTLNQTPEATGLCEEAIRMCWALTERAPTNVQWRRHLATARISMGDVRLSCNDLARARGDYEFAAGTMGALAALEREDLQGTRHYANSERKLGDLLCRVEDHGGALATYIRAASAMEAACAVATSARWNRELYEIYTALLRAHELVPGADPRTASEVRVKSEQLRARLAAA